jgi:hypothetical protein
MQAEVIPVDTHVLQIATKHYGFRGGVSGTKQAMSPKLYEAISEKFHGVWGNYSGWAHSVSFSVCFSQKVHADPLSLGIIHCRSKGILRLWSRSFVEETRCVHTCLALEYSPQAQRELEASPDAGGP